MLPVRSGWIAERRAEAFLRAEGLRLVQRNFRKPYGEIDLIARDGDELVFVEVRKRSHMGFADGAESIDRRKQRRLLRTAEAFLQQSGWNGPVRFDVLVLDASDRVEWLQGAIEATW